jgi:hypothetical protein
MHIVRIDRGEVQERTFQREISVQAAEECRQDRNIHQHRNRGTARHNASGIVGEFPVQESEACRALRQKNIGLPGVGAFIRRAGDPRTEEVHSQGDPEDDDRQEQEKRKMLEASHGAAA